MQELSEKELDISYAQGLLESFLDEKLLKDAYKTVQESLAVLSGGVAHYRDKYVLAQQDYTTLLEKYNQLTALSSQYLGMIERQENEIKNLLVNDQRDFHRTE